MQVIWQVFVLSSASFPGRDAYAAGCLIPAGFCFKYIALAREGNDALLKIKVMKFAIVHSTVSDQAPRKFSDLYANSSRKMCRPINLISGALKEGESTD